LVAPSRLSRFTDTEMARGAEITRARLWRLPMWVTCSWPGGPGAAELLDDPEVGRLFSTGKAAKSSGR